MISVIIPVFNAERSICSCINSIIYQTYQEWELILIDDGSSDSSSQLIDAFSQKDRRIFAYHQNNSGAGIARNYGIALSKGEYIVFVDSDDYIENWYFDALSKHYEDVVFIDVNQCSENGKVKKEEKASACSKLSRNDLIRNQLTGKMPWGGVRKAVRRSLLVDNSICFTSQRVGEEAQYSFDLLYFAESVSFITTPVYNYIVHSGSLSQSRNEDPWGELPAALKKHMTSLGVYEKYADSLNSLILSSAIISLDRIARYNSFKVFKKKARRRINKLYSEIDSAFPIDYCHMMKEARIVLPIVKMRMDGVFYLMAKIKQRIL